MTAAEESAPEQALAGANAVPQLYVNGFQLALSNADVAVVGMLDNQPAVKINMSYTLTKSLMVKLGQLMSALEKATGREIMTTDEAGVVGEASTK